MVSRIGFVHIALICLVLMLSGTITRGQEAKFIKEANAWIAENPSPDKEELLAFVNATIFTLDRIEDSYDYLFTMLESYPPSSIDPQFYLTFARIASLKYDFGTAALLYYAAFEETKNPKHLLQAGIQEYHAGNPTLAKRNIQILEEKYATEDFQVTLILLKTQIATAEQDYIGALLHIDALLKKNVKVIFPPALYYALYKTALLANNNAYAQFAQRQLQRYYPSSIEAGLILAQGIQPLPIPSHLFSFSSEEVGLNEIEYTDFAGGIEISELPKLGYQISAFQNLRSALDFSKKFTSSIKNLKINVAAPILSKSTVEDVDFYQVIIPLSEKKDTNAQISELRNEGIEGFLKIRK